MNVASIQLATFIAIYLATLFIFFYILLIPFSILIKTIQIAILLIRRYFQQKQWSDQSGLFAFCAVNRQIYTLLT